MNLREVYTLKEASQLWCVSDSNLRNALVKFNRFEKQIAKGTAKKSAGTWIITKIAMEEVFGKMNEYKNVNTGTVINEQELRELHIREYNEMWEDDRNSLVDDFETKEEFINYMLKNDTDSDFVLIEE